MDVQTLIIFAAGLIAGFLNGFAGGASVLSFPALIAVGLNPVSAAMTNALGVSTANVGALIGQFKRVAEIIRSEGAFIAFSMFGAIAGGLALVLMPISSFEKIVPILIVVASVSLFIKVQQNLTPLKKRLDYFWLTAVGFYAGYFGPGQGVMTIAILARHINRSVAEINIRKNVVVSMTCIGPNLIYILSGKVNWSFAIALAAGSAIGGFYGAKLVGRFSRQKYQIAIASIGIISAIWFAKEYWF